MPWTEGTLTPEDVASHLGIVADARLEQDVDAARQWVEDRRCLTDRTILWTNPSIHKGGVLYAGLLYQARSAPQGFDGYEDVYNSSTEALFRARDLVGADVVVA